MIARQIVVDYDSIPRAWAAGFARLDPDRSPGDMPLKRWRQFVDDVGLFLDCATGAALGWGALDLFGCDRDRPFARIDKAGLLLLLGGDTLIAVTTDTATIEARRRRRAQSVGPGSSALAGMTAGRLVRCNATMGGGGCGTTRRPGRTNRNGGTAGFFLAGGIFIKGDSIMARGGYRPGGGRPKGSLNRKPSKARRVQAEVQEATTAATEVIEPLETTPLGYMLGVMRNPGADAGRRDRMAIAAAPFMHKRTADVPERLKEVAETKAARAGKAGKFATPSTPLRLVANRLPDPPDAA